MSDHGSWPEAELGRIARLRLLAAGLPGVVLVERRIEVPFERFWPVLADLERSVPAFDHAVSELRIVGERGGRLDVRSRFPVIGIWSRFDVDLDDGWCWMVTRPRAYVVGMAAEPTADGATSYAHLEGLAPALPRWLAPVARPLLVLSRLRHRRHTRHDVDGIERLVVRN